MKRTLLLGLIILVSVLFIAAGESYATTYYIAPTGNDLNAGTSTGAPWATFAQAMTVLQPGDTLNLIAGTYNQQLNVTVSGTSGNYITIKAVNEGNAIVTTNDLHSLSISAQSYIEVDGINFRETGAADPNNFNGHSFDGISIYNSNNIILRRVTANGSSGYNTAVISLAGSSYVLLEDCAASGQGRMVLDIESCNYVTYRRCWLNWTGPSTGPFVGGLNNPNEIYDSNNTIAENNIVINPTMQATDGITVWGHYGSVHGNIMRGNIVYSPQGQLFGGLRDDAEYGNTTSGTVIQNNVVIALSQHYNYDITGSDTKNSNPNNGTVYANNTYIGPGSNSTSSNAIELDYYDGSQNASISNIYNNSLAYFMTGMSVDTSSGGTRTIQAHDYNNIWTASGGNCLNGSSGMVPPNLNTNEHCNTLNPNYDTSIYGLGAYLMVPSVLRGLGQGGADIGASVLYEYQDGTLTGTPLWPWPMESRIVAEFGVSPTYQDDGNGHTGGIWETLNGVYSGTSSPDTTPDPFTFAYQIGDPLNTTETSNPITVSGINSPTPISISNGTYSVNGGAYTSDAGTVNNGDTVTVRVNSSSSPGTMVNATLTVGGVSGVFSVITSGPSPSNGSYGFLLPDTGQTNCYDSSGNVITCTGTGQDGAYPINAMSYTDNGNGSITDNVTGLMWQKQDDGTTRPWSDAGMYCAGLSVGGYSDWRLPTQKELMTILDYSIADPGPTINTTYFPNTQGSYYWSSTTDADDTGSVWYVNFGSDSVYSYYQAYTNYVRCVRGQQAAAGLTDNGDGTVTDSGTGLTWQKAAGGSMSWANALSYCTGMSLGGQSDWRLPNIKELNSITDYTRYDPAINTTFFPNAQAYLFWSSTTNAADTDYAWYVYSLNGVVDNGSKSYYGYVRCVSNAQSRSLGNSVLLISIAGTGIGTVTADSGTIIWSGNTGTASYSSGTSVTLTAAAGPGSTFTGWSGECSSQSASANCVVTMSAAAAVTSNYVITGTTPFSDVPSGSKYESYIEAIYNNGITAGCGNGDYCPSEDVTRDQMAAFLVRATQVKAGQGPENFTCDGGVAGAAVDCAATTPYFIDVPGVNADQFFPYIQKLYELGMTTGCGNGDYCPSEDVTRDQMAAFVIRALYGENFTCNGGVAGAAVACASTAPYFIDVPGVTSDQLFPYIQKLYELGITTGCGNGDYCPSEYVTRDQMAAFLARAFLGMQ